MAQKIFEEEQKPIVDFCTFVFMLMISFWLGMSIEAYHIKKYLPKCEVTKVQQNPPKDLPNKGTQSIEDIKKLEVFINGSK